MVRIRLARHGTHKRPFYRIVVAPQRGKRDGGFLEIVGTYDPLPAQAVVNLDAERVQHWLSVGAQPSETVKSLIERHMPKA